MMEERTYLAERRAIILEGFRGLFSQQMPDGSDAPITHPEAALIVGELALSVSEAQAPRARILSRAEAWTFPMWADTLEASREIYVLLIWPGEPTELHSVGVMIPPGEEPTEARVMSEIEKAYATAQRPPAGHA